MKTGTKALLIAVAVLMLGVVGSMDLEDAMADEEHYCQMASEGVWPMRDYCR